MLQAKATVFMQIILYIFVNKSSFKSLQWLRTPWIQNGNLNIAFHTQDLVMWQFCVYVHMKHIFQAFWMQLLNGDGEGTERYTEKNS